MKLKKLSFLAAGIAAAVLTAFPVQASSVINAVPQVIQEESRVTAGNPVTYFGSEVLEAYTYNPEKYTYHRISDSKQLALLIKLLESGKTKSPKADSEGGFLLVTANGRHEIYIDSQEKELLTLCQNNNAVSPGLVQWLVFMNTDRMTSAEFTDEGCSETDKGKSFKTDERWALEELSKILKTIRVKSGTRSTENPLTGYMYTPGFHIEFNTGVFYNVNFYETDELEIWSSDMKYHIVYSLQQGETERIFKATQEIGKKNPTYILRIQDLENKASSIQVSGSWGDSHFYIDTSDSKKIGKIYKVLKKMRIYGVGISTEPGNRNPMTSSSYNGFVVNISYQDGVIHKFEDYNGELWVYVYNEKHPKEIINYAVYGYTFPQESHKEFYDALSQAAR